MPGAAERLMRPGRLCRRFRQSLTWLPPAAFGRPPDQARFPLSPVCRYVYRLHVYADLAAPAAP